MTNHLSTLSVALLLLLFSGCAQKQWQDPLKDKEADTARQQVLQMITKRQACTCCVDAEVAARWESKLYSGGLNGYLQIFKPASFKLVAINPLGQPLFALTTNGVTFQSINAVKGVYKHGKVASFVERHSIPETVFHDQWAAWLTGSMTFAEEDLTDLRRDEQSRGIWLAVTIPDSKYFSREYLLVDLLQGLLLERVVYDVKGDEAARIRYQKWEQINDCPLPTLIDVHGESFAATITIELTDIITDKIFSPDTFSLKLPPGYLRQYYP